MSYNSAHSTVCSDSLSTLYFVTSRVAIKHCVSQNTLCTPHATHAEGVTDYRTIRCQSQPLTVPCRMTSPATNQTTPLTHRRLSFLHSAVSPGFTCRTLPRTRGTLVVMRTSTNRDTIILFSSSLTLCLTLETVDPFTGGRSNREGEGTERRGQSRRESNWIGTALSAHITCAYPMASSCPPPTVIDPVILSRTAIRQPIVSGSIVCLYRGLT